MPKIHGSFDIFGQTGIDETHLATRNDGDWYLYLIVPGFLEHGQL